MIPAPFRYHRAASLEDALSALAEPEARALAGGMSLLPLLKLRVVRPSLLVDLGRLDLAGIDRGDGTLRVGALTTWDALASASELRAGGLAALGECAAGIGDLQVRNRGTAGGSLAHADPAGDLAAVALALGATIEARGPDGERVIPAEAFFLGPFETPLARGELVTAVRLPVPPEGSGSAYVKVEHPASGFALAGAAALVMPDGGARVAVTAVAARPTLLAQETELERLEVVGDRFAGTEYRRHLARVVVHRAIERARARAEGSAR